MQIGIIILRRQKLTMVKKKNMKTEWSYATKWSYVTT